MMIQYRARISTPPGGERVVESDTVAQALLSACMDLRTGVAEPIGIYGPDGTLLHDRQSIQDQCIELADEQ